MYKFRPIVKTMVWGTETWVVSAVPGSESVVSEGPEAGKSITELFPDRFPLLIKFIDAHQNLSIQVHPNDRIAAERHGCNGKTEMWYIIDSIPEARILDGFVREIERAEYEEHVSKGTIMDVLADHKASHGDVFFLPAGRVHAICGGCYLAEIQQTCDISYRIFDYNRPGLDGKPRKLHTLEAMDAIDFTVPDDYRTHYQAQPDKTVDLIHCQYFATSLLELTKPFSSSLDNNDEFLIVICTEGHGNLNGSPVKAGEAVVLTPKDGIMSLVPEDGRLTVLTCHQ